MCMINESDALLAYSEPDGLIESALRVLEERAKTGSDLMQNPQEVSAYLRLQLAGESNEVFAVLFLNNAHRLLSFEKLFYGTVNCAHVHPRVVVQRALALNSAAVILAHNHPSGVMEPSSADIMMTKILKEVLKVIDVRVLDHVIVSDNGSYSFVQHGLL